MTIMLCRIKGFFVPLPAGRRDARHSIRGTNPAVARGGILMAALFAVLFMAALSGCSGERKGPSQKEQVPVTVAAAVQKPVRVELRAIGSVEASNSVQIKSQVTGQLMRVHFTEGKDVKEGDLLFTIDPRPFEMARTQAEANLVKDRVQLENARTEARRYAELFQKGYVSREQYDQFQTSSDALEATANADKAAVENAKLQLSYCYIRSPITGRTGSVLVDLGNMVKANDDNKYLVAIYQIQPINVTFAVPQQHLAEVRARMAGGPLRVDAVIPGESRPVAAGALTFIDNSVDTKTGTITLKGTFENKDRALWPGLYVDVVLTLKVEPDAIVAPSEAVQSGQSGQFVFVVKDDLTVESRPVTVSRTVDREAVITKGLKPGERVVTEGQLRLVPGTSVEIKTPEPQASGQGP